MANFEHLTKLKQGAINWIDWLDHSHQEEIDLINADLRGIHLLGVYLVKANLTGADLTSAKLSKANLTGANLQSAELIDANLIETNFTGANLQSAYLIDADLHQANLIGADLRAVMGRGANFSGATSLALLSDKGNYVRQLMQAKLSRANLSETA